MQSSHSTVRNSYSTAFQHNMVDNAIDSKTCFNAKCGWFQQFLQCCCLKFKLSCCKTTGYLRCIHFLKKAMKLRSEHKICIFSQRIVVTFYRFGGHDQNHLHVSEFYHDSVPKNIKISLFLTELPVLNNRPTRWPFLGHSVRSRPNLAFVIGLLVACRTFQ